MLRMIDLRCLSCGHVIRDVMRSDDADADRCPECSGAMEQLWWSLPRKNAQWQTPTVVFVSRDPDKVKAGVDKRYPMRADAPTPSGYERVEIRSDHAMGRFEKQNQVIHHDRWYDRNGRGPDSTIFGERVDH